MSHTNQSKPEENKVAGTATPKRFKYVWKRQALPDDNAPKINQLGVVFISIGLLLLFFGWVSAADSYSDFSDIAPLMLWAGVGMVHLSVIVFLFGAVIDELRRASFEAALRAGEVEKVAYGRQRL